MVGLTTLVIVGAVPLKEEPSESVPLIVPLPVTASVRVAVWPLQIVVVPVMFPVGVALITALPLIVAVHPPGPVATIVYVPAVV